MVLRKISCKSKARSENRNILFMSGNKFLDYLTKAI